jgi:hypothetical protein
VTSSPPGRRRGGPFRELAVGVDQLHCQAVELGLADVAHLVRAEDLVDPGVEFGQLLVGEGVGQAEHRAAVGDRAEAVGGRSSHPDGGGVGGAELGEVRLQSLELAHPRVVLGVAQLGVVEDVVTVVGAGDLRLQLVGSGSRGGSVHRGAASWIRGARSA